MRARVVQGALKLILEPIFEAVDTVRHDIRPHPPQQRLVMVLSAQDRFAD